MLTEMQKEELKYYVPFVTRVLVRMDNISKWIPAVYVNHNDKGIFIIGSPYTFPQFVRYENYEYLLGNTYNIEESWKPTEGELIAVRNCKSGGYLFKIFSHRDDGNTYACFCDSNKCALNTWKYAKPLKEVLGEYNGNIQ